MNPNHFFDRTVIINLPERTDRKEETIRELLRFGWRVDGEKTMFVSAISPEDAAGFPNAGVRGCFLSHLNAIRNARRDNLSNILVMEDDIAFVSGMGRILGHALDIGGWSDWDLLYLGHDESLHGRQEHRLVKMESPLSLAHCYAVKDRIFDRLTGFLETLARRQPGDLRGGPMHYDGALSTFRAQNPDITTYALMPGIAYQRSSRTDLHRLPPWDRWVVLRPAVSALRRLGNAVKRATN